MTLETRIGVLTTYACYLEYFSILSPDVAGLRRIDEVNIARYGTGFRSRWSSERWIYEDKKLAEITDACSGLANGAKQLVVVYEYTVYP